jgi:uncharacterized protein YndB with AHSA1/START domain
MSTPDVPHRFEIELVVPGSAEQVWHAIASAEGISAWMLPTELEPREGGAVTFHMGPDASSRGRITHFEPARRVAYEEDWASLVGHPDADVTPLVTEFLVEARAGGTCVVRVVSSAFGTGADWENEFWEEMSSAWAPMLDNLRVYLTDFPGQQAVLLWANANVDAAADAAITAVRQELGVGAVGDEVSARGISGRVERLIDRHFLLRVDQPVPGFVSFWSLPADGSSALQIQGYFFSERAAAYVERAQTEWETWLNGVASELTARSATR